MKRNRSPLLTRIAIALSTIVFAAPIAYAQHDKTEERPLYEYDFDAKANSSDLGLGAIAIYKDRVTFSNGKTIYVEQVDHYTAIDEASHTIYKVVGAPIEGFCVTKEPMSYLEISTNNYTDSVSMYFYSSQNQPKRDDDYDPDAPVDTDNMTTPCGTAYYQR